MATFQGAVVDTAGILADIERLAAIESPTPHAAGVDAVLGVIAGWFEGTGSALERSRIDPRFGDMLRVRCDPDRTAPGILVLSHVDTVHPLGTLKQALALRRDGDRLYGPGVYDMKGGAVLGISAFRRLAARRAARPLPLTFLFTPDEEVGSVASRKHIEAEAARARYVLVVEPKRDGGRITLERKGTGRFRIAVRGRPAHAGARHQQGRSAIRAAARLILEIEGFTDYARGITTNVGLVSGGTGVNVIPEHCTLESDLRVTDLDGAAEMEARFRKLASGDPDIELTVTGGLTRPPLVRTPGTDALYAKAQEIARRIGMTIDSAGLVGGGSDGNLAATQGVPVLDGLGVDGDGAHTLAEHLLVSSIEPGTRLIEGLMETLA